MTDSMPVGGRRPPTDFSPSAPGVDTGRALLQAVLESPNTVKATALAMLVGKRGVLPEGVSLTSTESSLLGALQHRANPAGLPAMEAFIAAEPVPLDAHDIASDLTRGFFLGPALEGMRQQLHFDLLGADAAERERFRAMAAGLFGEDSSTLFLHGGESEVDPAHWHARLSTWSSVEKTSMLVTLLAKEAVEPLGRVEAAALSVLRELVGDRIDVAQSLAKGVLHFPGTLFIEEGKGSMVEVSDRETLFALDPTQVEHRAIRDNARALFGEDASTAI
jgi:hypothetical protein